MNKLMSLMVLMAVAISGCAYGTTPTSGPAADAGNPKQTGWQQEWEQTVAAARQEGKVSIVIRFPGNVRDSLAEAFKQKYGIATDFVAGNILEIWPKMEAERRAGLYVRDVAMDGSTALTGTIVAGDAAAGVESVLILPEVKDGNLWRDKKLPFYDKDKKIFMYLSRVGPTLVVNKEVVKAEELKSWRNLLEPKWKGKILMFDPSIPGPGNSIIATVAEIMGLDYLKELAKQDLVINRDTREQVEWIARNKYAVGLGFDFTMFEDMRAAGVPLLHVVPSEGTYFGSATGSMSVFSNPANPNAQKVFVNWFLSREGQTSLVKAAKEGSRRLDVAPELSPDRVFQEGIKYIDFDTEYMFGKRTEILNTSKQIFAAQYK